MVLEQPDIDEKKNIFLFLSHIRYKKLIQNKLNIKVKTKTTGGKKNRTSK